MRLDEALKLATAQAFTDVGGGQVTTLSHDLGNTSPKRDIGAGEPMCLVYFVDVAAAGATDTWDLKVVQSDNDDLSANEDLASRRIAKADLVAGSYHIVDIPSKIIDKRYIGGEVGVGAADTMTCSVYGPIPRSAVDQNDRYYPSGFVVD